MVRHDQRAPRLAPGDRDRPQSVVFARLAPKKWRSFAKIYGKAQNLPGFAKMNGPN